jgi:hypothetical protein
MKLIFTENAEIYLKKKTKAISDQLNLVLHVKDKYMNCYTIIEPDITFETDENYLDGINKISDWNEKINIYLDPAIEPLIKEKEELIIDTKGKLFKKLVVTNADSKTKYGCRVVFGKDISTSGITLS